jgi:hypothetical protein
MNSRKIIFFELNEVPYRVIDRYCQDHPTAALTRLLARSAQSETHAADSGELAPTKTWPTVHRGVNNDHHGLTNFGQDLTEVDQAFPPIWQIAARHGVEVGVFGSFFSFPMPAPLDNYAFYMPDAFAIDSDAHPAELEAFQSFNLAMSRASMRNVSKGIDLPKAAQLLPQLPKLGFTGQTAVGIARQLVGERRTPRIKTRRRTHQTMLGFDVFMQQLQTRQPAFCTFFTNHVAATMHRYWAATFPEDYQQFNLADDWVADFRSEIDFAMDKTNELVERLLRFVDGHPDYVLMVVTSMGQAASRAESVSSCVSITDMQQFLGHLGLQSGDYEERPAMAPIFNVVIQPEKSALLRQHLGHLTIDGKPFAQELYENFFEFAFGPFQNYQGPEVVTIGAEQLPFAHLGFANVAHEDGVYLTGDHIPQGALLVYDPQRPQVRSAAARTQISTLDIAPTILQNFAIPVPAYMSRPVDLISA